MQNSTNIGAKLNTLIAQTKVIIITGIKTTKICDMLNKSVSPKKVRVGTPSVRWVKAEVWQWANEQVAARKATPQARGMTHG